MDKIKVIAFDADDTLWVNEPFFRDTEEKFHQLLQNGMDLDEVTKHLFEVEIANIPMYGYGIKGFTLSMIETAMKLTNHTISAEKIQQIIELGREQMEQPIELLDGVEQILEQLQGKYKLIVATKGDLMDQERKLQKSGLLKYFHHIEVMSEKAEADYQKLLANMEIEANEFMMVGNSLKSDVLPVLNLGGKAVHIPFHTTWEHEKVKDSDLEAKEYQQLHKISELREIV
jgi:putative hydrolase of the HAD superfamily